MARIGPRVDANHIAGIPERGTPNGSIRWAHRDRIEAGDDALVFPWVDRLVGLDTIVALAVAVGVENEGRPTLRFLLVAGLLEHFAVEPAENRRLRAAGAGPQRLVGVCGEVQVMRREAGADQRELAG